MLYPEDWEDNVLSNPDGIMVDKSSTCEIPLVIKEGSLIPIKSEFTLVIGEDRMSS